MGGELQAQLFFLVVAGEKLFLLTDDPGYGVDIPSWRLLERASGEEQSRPAPAVGEIGRCFGGSSYNRCVGDADAWGMVVGSCGDWRNLWLCNDGGCGGQSPGEGRCPLRLVAKSQEVDSL